MGAVDLVVRGRRVITPAGERACAVHIRDGVIAAVTEPDAIPAGTRIVDAGDAVVSPGAVDIHVHVNEPGRTEWEGFDSATRAAAAGGVTTIVDMPLNSIPPTTTPAALEAKRAAARGQCWVDVGFWGGAVPGGAGEVPALHAAGVLGFKAFLAPSGVEEFGCLDLDELKQAAAAVAGIDGLLAVHAELPGPIEAATAALEGADWRRHETYLASRPPAAEVEAVRAVGEAAARTGCRVHILHLSAADALAAVREAAAGGAHISAETCPHYLALAAEDVSDGQTAFKCAPPIRDRGNRETLWAALADGTLTAVASDHSPSPPERKAGDFRQAWGGIASLQIAPAVLWTAARARGHDLAALAGWLAAGPARIAGLARKGAIEPGRDADLVLWHPEETFSVDVAALEHRHAISPYDGRLLHGAVEATYLRGVVIWQRGAPATDAPQGLLLERGAA